MAPLDAQVAVVGGGVVGTAVACALARRGLAVILLEAEEELARGASGTNSGILHTGFDSAPGELETRLILRAAELRESALEELGVPVMRCGARLEPRSTEERATVEQLALGARRNGVRVALEPDGSLLVPGEAVTDPVAYTQALALGALRQGAELRTGASVQAIERNGEQLVLRTAKGEAISARAIVNAAGLYADEVARMAGDHSFGIYPRKGEFFVFHARVERILLPVPTKRTKGVLVFPTLDGMTVAGPTAHDQEDKRDWTVRPEARDEVLAKAVAMHPALDGLEPVASYAGLRPAGRDGANYLIGHSSTCRGLVNVAAIRSTGLTASLAIGEHAAGLVAELGLEPAPPPEPRTVAALRQDGRPWWRRAAERPT